MRGKSSFDFWKGNLSVSGLVHLKTRISRVKRFLNADSIVVPDTFPASWAVEVAVA